MSTATLSMTAEELLLLADDCHRLELVKGEVREMSPAGGQHGWLAMRLGANLFQYVEARGLGRVFAAETGFRLARNPDTVRAPDVAFVAAPRSEEARSQEGFIALAPDLVVEVLSPSDRYTETEEKVMDWLKAGTRVVVLLNPRNTTAVIYRAKDQISVLSEGDLLAFEDVIPGWSMALGELFR